MPYSVLLDCTGLYMYNIYFEIPGKDFAHCIIPSHCCMRSLYQHLGGSLNLGRCVFSCLISPQLISDGLLQDPSLCPMRSLYQHNILDGSQEDHIDGLVQDCSNSSVIALDKWGIMQYTGGVLVYRLLLQVWIFPLKKVRSWNNGIRCTLCYFLK